MVEARFSGFHCVLLSIPSFPRLGLLLSLQFATLLGNWVKKEPWNPGRNPTSFPGSLLFTPQEAREGRPWLGLVTCLPKSGRLQISDWREGRLSVSLPILSVPGMGKHAPVRIARVSKVMSSGPLKRCINRANL